MALHRRAARRDANEGIIIEAMQARGWIVLRLSIRGGPDLLAFRNQHVGLGNYVWLFKLVEVKSKRGKLTADQIAWRKTWQGPEPVIVRSVEDAIRL